MCHFKKKFPVFYIHVKQEQSVFGIIVVTVSVNLNYCLSEIKFLISLGLWKPY